MIDVLIMAGQLILGLSLLVGLHELGHLLTAKMFGMRVEKYYIGFPPKIWSMQRGETEYGIGAIPLGGFVKISGMIDESLDTKNMSAQPEPWEFRAKPAWQRLIVMLGGIVVNVVTGVIIFVALTYANGKNYYSVNDAKYGIVASDMAQEMGLKTGDKIVKINGKPFDDFNEIRKIFLESNSYYTILRGGKELDVEIPNDFIEKLSDKKNEGKPFVEPITPFVVGDVPAGTTAQKAGLKAGDKIVRINQTPVQFYHEFKELAKANSGKPVVLGLVRNNEPTNINLTVNPDGSVGFFAQTLLKPSHIDYGIGESVVMGTSMAFSTVYDQIKAFGKIFRGEISAQKSLGSFVTIGKAYGNVFDWVKFWSLTGMLSMVLAFMNLLPIPALDGGHTVFLLFEMITGRKPSDTFLENAQKVGMVLLLGLMVFAFGNDIMKLFL